MTGESRPGEVKDPSNRINNILSHPIPERGELRKKYYTDIWKVLALSAGIALPASIVTFVGKAAFQTYAINRAAGSVGFGDDIERVPKQIERMEQAKKGGLSKWIGEKIDRFLEGQRSRRGIADAGPFLELRNKFYNFSKEVNRYLNPVEWLMMWISITGGIFGILSSRMYRERFIDLQIKDAEGRAKGALQLDEVKTELMLHIKDMTQILGVVGKAIGEGGKLDLSKLSPEERARFDEIASTNDDIANGLGLKVPAENQGAALATTVVVGEGEAGKSVKLEGRIVPGKPKAEEDIFKEWG